MKSLKVSNWTDHIAKLSTRPKYQNATIEIRDSTVKPDYDIDTGKYTYPTGSELVLYRGRARIQAIRWDVFLGGESQGNAKTIAAIRVQIPKDAVGRLTLGDAVLVIDSEDNAFLPGTIFNVSSGFQGSAQAARTFEAAADSDAVYAGGDDAHDG